MKEIKLFDYQQEMLENITEVFSAAAFDTVLYNEKGKRVNVGSSVMVQMPTGTGKTYVMAAVVKWFLETIEPFISEDGRLMGLRTPDEVVMKPKFRYISKFRGDYAILGVRERLPILAIKASLSSYLYTFNDSLGIFPDGGFITILNVLWYHGL